MEPALDERGDYAGQLERAGLTPPQWSPLSTSGATRGSTVDGRRRSARRNGARSRRAGRQAHSRKHEDQAKGRNGARSRRAGRPRSHRALPLRPWSRNGARSRRAGRLVDRRQERHPGQAAMEPALDERGDVHTLLLQLATFLPQWSPLSTSGATPASVQMRTIPTRAAMEPALDERGDRRRAGLPGLARQAAMEPALDERGDVALPRVRHCPIVSRNGARSRRAGRPANRGSFRARIRAAMEPALDERGDLCPSSSWTSLTWPQWSPLSTSGATRAA